MGEWGWIIAGKKTFELGPMNFDKIPVKWINDDAMKMMVNFGKINVDTTGIQVNTISNPVTYRYYKSGNWSF